jgi:CheY-like chemotaxis protein
MEDSKDHTILIVEDEIIIALDIQDTLKRIGYPRTSVAESGEAALVKLSRELPDLIMMDIGLGGTIDGIDTAEQIRSTYTALPILFLTSYSNTKIRSRASLIPHSGYILKPYTSDMLATAINTALRPQ